MSDDTPPLPVSGPGASTDASPFPDRLSADPDSPYFNEALLAQGVGIRFNGVERTTVQEYCISEGWVRVTIGKTVDRKGRPLTQKLNGVVEAFHKA